VGGPWIPSRDAAGRSLPGILTVFVFAVAVGFIIGFLPDCRSMRKTLFDSFKTLEPAHELVDLMAKVP
jgi:hypothetical protein